MHLRVLLISILTIWIMGLAAAWAAPAARKGGLEAADRPVRHASAASMPDGRTLDAPVILLQDGRVTVSVSLSHSFLNFWEANIVVRSGRFRWGTVSGPIAADANAALESLRREIRWKGDYLFIRENLFHGNAWRCGVDHILSIKSGHMRYLGNVGDDTGTRPPGWQYDGRFFQDIYDRFESGPCTCHVGASGFAVFLEERNGKFVANLEETWRRGKKEYNANMAVLKEEIRTNPMLPSRFPDDMCLRPTFTNMILARYCRRTEEYAAMKRLASGIFDKPDKMYRAAAKVVPGEVPGFADRDPKTGRLHGI